MERDEFEPISKAEQERMPVKGDSHHAAAGMKGNNRRRRIDFFSIVGKWVVGGKVEFQNRLQSLLLGRFYKRESSLLSLAQRKDQITLTEK